MADPRTPGTFAPRIPPAYHVLPKRIFYGWYIAIACSVLMMITVGIGYYGLAVFLTPLQEEHGWSNTIVSSATSAFFVISGIIGAAIGPSVDRRGSIPFLVAAAFCTGIAVSLLGLITEIWQLFALYAVLAAGYGMGASMTTNAILTRWFVERRALATSIGATGISLGGIVLVPVGAWLVEEGGLSLAGPVLGVAAFAIPLPVALLVLVFDPRQMGLRPDGTPPRDDAETRPPRLSEASQQRLWTMREAMQTVSFWAVLITFVLMLMAQTGVVIHQIAFLEERLGSRSEAAFTLSVTAFGSTAARLIVGLFADRLDKRWLTCALCLLQATSILLLLQADSTWSLFVLTLIFGFTLGNMYMMQSLLTGEIFGMLSFGTIFGLVVFAGQLGAGLGPLLIGVLEDRSGGYDLAFTITAALGYIAAVIVLFARPVEHRGPPSEATSSVIDTHGE